MTTDKNEWYNFNDDQPPVDVPVLVIGSDGTAVATRCKIAGGTYLFVEPYSQSFDGEKYLWRFLPPLPAEARDFDWAEQVIEDFATEPTDG